MADWGKVIGVTETMRMGKTREPEKYYRYQAESKGGIVFTELIAEGAATPEKVDTILKAKAQRLDKTLAL